MARKEVTQFYDDLDGKELASSDVRTVEFAFKNANYVIDLSVANAEKFDKDMGKWIEKAHRTTRQSKAFYQKKPERRDLPLVRKWLREANMQVSDRGRIPQHLLDMYDNRDK